MAAGTKKVRCRQALKRLILSVSKPLGHSACKLCGKIPKVRVSFFFATKPSGRRVVQEGVHKIKGHHVIVKRPLAKHLA